MRNPGETAGRVDEVRGERPADGAVERKTRAESVLAAFTRAPEDIPTVADFAVAYEWIGRPLPRVRELRASGVPVREVSR